MVMFLLRLLLLAALVLAGCSSSSPTSPDAVQDRDQIQSETNQPDSAPTTRTSDAADQSKS